MQHLSLPATNEELGAFFEERERRFCQMDADYSCLPTLSEWKRRLIRLAWYSTWLDRRRLGQRDSPDATS